MSQGLNEELADYVQRFRIQAQKCVDNIDEQTLVNVCINKAQVHFQPHLITKGWEKFKTLFVSFPKILEV